MKRKTYSLHLTEGLGGKSIKCLSRSSSIDEINKKIYEWLNDPNTAKHYRVMPYMRTICHKETNERFIDFGDYSFFLTVKNPTK